MKGSKSSFLVRIWKVYGHISSWGDYIKLGIKDIDSMNNSVKTRKSESCVALILPNIVLAVTKATQFLLASNQNSRRQQLAVEYQLGFLPSRNLLVSTGDNEISVIHGN